MKRTPGWRDAAAAALLARHVPPPDPGAVVLLMEDPLDSAADALGSAGARVHRWQRRVRPGGDATPWPPEGPFHLVALRLPRAKDELEMAVHAAVSVLAPGGRLYVYGAKDEGIGSAGRRIEEVAGPVHTVATGGHCRLLTATRPQAPSVRVGLDAWRTETVVDLGRGPRPWVGYPGVFADGRVDRGTALLLEAMPAVSPGSRVLDFGCGSGVIAGALLARTPDLVVDALDVDAVALVAAAENVPEARTVLAEGTGSLAPDAYDLVVSNPPYHVGKAESKAVVEALVDDAPRILAPGGRLVMVVQRRLDAEPMLRRALGQVEAIAEDATYRVWSASRPSSRRAAK